MPVDPVPELILILGFIGMVFGVISFPYAIYCQRQNDKLQNALAKDNKIQLNEVSFSISKIDTQL
jgi:hypothetical protein